MTRYSLIVGEITNFEELYEALYQIVGSEDDANYYHDARIRILGLCYELRQALMGDRNAVFKEHSMARSK